jgi:hypothetical protein
LIAKKLDETKRDQNMDTFLIQSNIKTKEMVAECTENRTTLKENPLLRFPHFAGDFDGT